MNDKIIKEILRNRLLMGYDLSKTYEDNLNEQTFPTGSETPFDPNIDKSVRSEKEKQKYEYRKSNEYPNYCRYKQYTVDKPELCDQLKQKNELEEIKKFCFYPGMVPIPESKDIEYHTRTLIKKESGTGVAAYPIDNESQIIFQTIESITKFRDKIVSENPKAFDTDTLKQDLLEKLMRLIPLNTIQSFVLPDGNQYVSSFSFKNEMEVKFEFYCYRNKITKECYVAPECQDNRTDYQKWVDEWGSLLQWGAMVGSIIAGVATGGAGWLLIPEILTELGLGVMIGIREWGKGEKISSIISFVTGILPFFKTFDAVRGIPEKYWNEISDKLKLKPLNDETDLENFYTGLSEDGKKAWNILVRQDEYGRFKMGNQIAKEISENFDNIIWTKASQWFEKNPDKIKRINFCRRLWVRETGANLGVIISGILVKAFFGGKLEPSEKDKLDGIIFALPDGKKKELAENLISNGQEISKRFISSFTEKDINRITNLVAKQSETLLDEYMQKKMKESGGKWGRSSEDKTEGYQSSESESDLLSKNYVEVSIEYIIDNEIDQTLVKEYLGSYFIPKNKYVDKKDKTEIKSDSTKTSEMDSLKLKVPPYF